jgi:hypothetical protein
MKLRTAFVLSVLILASSVTLADTDKRDEKSRGPKVERTIAANPNVSVSACLMSGSIKVHGWDRNEVRARSLDAAEIDFRRTDASADSSPARKIELRVADRAQGPGHANTCESFSEVELDVPRGATVQLQTRDSDITVFEVATVYVSTQNGDVSIERAMKTVDAGTIGGSILLKNSSGRIHLHSAGGSIEATDVRPAEAGDSFEASSLGGEITLDRVSHAQLNAHTLNGSLCVTGPLTHGGRYGFRTISGDLTLTLPSDSSFKLSAKFSQQADIITDFPLALTQLSTRPSPVSRPSPAPAVSPAPVPDRAPAPTVEDPKVVAKVKTNKGTVVVDVSSFGLRRIEGIHGSGDAMIELASFSGTIHLRKQ